MTDSQAPKSWMTQSERLRAIVSHAERHCISSDVLFAVLVALEDAFFIQDDADEYNNDEAIAAFKALEAEIKHPKPTLTDEEREAVEWFAEVRKPLTRLTQSHNREKYKDTLCGLLERLK
jgi:hypothetical protein